MSSNLYDILGIDKNSSKEDIKKAYRKKAMQYHPDRNKGDKNAEKHFKEINQAYDILGDAKKKQQYDTFGSSGGNPFGGGGGSGAGYSSSGFGGFEDMFGGTGNNYGGGATFNMEDLFGGSMGGSQTRRKTAKKQEPENLDFQKTYEVPIFDLILGCKIEVKGVYGNTAKLKIPPSTKSGTKFRVKGFGKKEPGIEGNLIVKVEGIMPKNISDVDMSMLERIRENIGY